MEIPDLIRQRLDDEEIDSAVNLSDEDLVCFTPTRTLLYRGVGLLSDESVEVYEHDVERLDVSEGRRKTTFTLTYVDREEQFRVASDRTEAVLERLLSGILSVAGVIGPEESVEGAFRFSEMTFIVTSARAVKHIGKYVWDEDFEEFPYSQVTGLEFEEGSVATQIVLSVDGRPQRIKAPSDEGRLVRHTLTNALFEYYEVDSLSQLNDAVARSELDEGDESTPASSAIELDDTISPLVGGSEEDPAEQIDDRERSSVETESGEDESPPTETHDTSRGEDETDVPGQTTQDTTSTSTDSSGGVPDTRTDDEAIDPQDVEMMKTRLTTLTKVVKRQNKLLKQQQETIDQLVEELKRQ